MSWSELFSGKSSIYALDEISKEWVDRGISGQLIMYQSNQYQSDVRIKWIKNQKEIWWRLMNGKLKPKGERAWVLKAWDIKSNKQEILAIRFSDVTLSQQFSIKFHAIFPQQPQPQSSANSQPHYAQNQYIPQHHNFQGGYAQNGMMGMQGMNAMNNNFRNMMMGQQALNGMGGLKRSTTSTWECAVCTYSNDSSKTSCIMCGLSRANTSRNKTRPHAQSSPAQYIPQQQQQVLFIKNHFSFGDKALAQLHGTQSQQNMIKQFESHRMDASAVTSPHSNRRTTWICPMCTLSNSINVTRCDACNASRNIGSQPSPQSAISPNYAQFGSGMGGVSGPGMGSFQHQQHQQQQWQQQQQRQQQNQFNFGAQHQGGGGMGSGMAMGSAMGFGAQPYQPPQGGNGMNNNNNGINGGNGMNGVPPTKPASTVKEFQQSASDIACYNDNPSQVFSTLRSVAKKLLKDDVRYRTLDTTNPKVTERLIGFEGVLDFLMLLGFSSDAMGMKLICEEKPSQQVVRNAIDVLNIYETRLGLGRQKKRPNGMGGGNGGTGNRVSDDDTQSRVTLGGPDDFDNGGSGGNNDDSSDSFTLEQIIIIATHENMRDSDTMETLILTHKQFTTSVTLLKSLRRRFFVPTPVDIASDESKVSEFRLNVEKRIQLKVIKSLRDWMKQYWEEDMVHDLKLQEELEEWLKELQRAGSTKKSECPWIEPLAKTVSNEYGRFKVQSPGFDKREQMMQWKQDPNTGVPLKLKEVSTKKGFKLSNTTAEELAEQITLMDFATFSRIGSRECIGQCWKKKKEESPNVLAMIKQFNQLTVLVQIQILSEKNLRDRGKAIKRVIKMGDRFLLLRNYNSLCAILGALNSSPIHRLKCAWARVPEKQLTLFEEFKKIFVNTRNFRNFRTKFRTVSPPAIPYFGLFLQDLVFIDDGNASKVQHDNLKQHGFQVNFSKFVRTMDRIKNGLAIYQKTPYHDIKPNQTLQKILYQELHKMSKITEDEIWNTSTTVRDADQKAAGIKKKN